MIRVCFSLWWGFIFGFQMFLISTNIFTFRKRTRAEYLKAFISTIILYMILIYCNTSDNYYIQFLVCAVLETGILFFVLMAFTESKNLMVDALLYTIMVWVSNICWYACCMLVPDFAKVGIFDYSATFNMLHIVGAIILILLAYIVMIFYKRVVSGRLDFLYSNKIFMLVYPVIIIINLVRYMARLKYYKNYMAPVMIFTILMWIAIIIILIYIYNMLKKRRIMRENREAALIFENIFTNYEDMVKENNELRDLKHDLNRQLDVIKELSVTEGQQGAREYMLQLVTEKAGSLALPSSGNIDIDTILAIFGRKAAKLSVCFEEVIEPYCDTKLETVELIGLFTIIMDDVFAKCAKESGKPWVRISIRERGKNTMIKVEYSKHKKHYTFGKLFYHLILSGPDMIKNDIVLKRLMDKYDMTYIYEEDEEKNTLAMVI